MFYFTFNIPYSTLLSQLCHQFYSIRLSLFYSTAIANCVQRHTPTTHERVVIEGVQGDTTLRLYTRRSDANLSFTFLFYQLQLLLLYLTNDN